MASRISAALLDKAERGQTVKPYDVATAEVHGRLLAHVHRSGNTRGTHDLMIAATAVAIKRIILTTDRSAKYHDLPGVDCIVVT